jgi:hypothetical protein
MHIDVVGDESISLQARSYAEYRLFAALPFVVDASRVRRALMLLRRTDDDRCPGTVCAVSIELDNDEVLRLRTTAAHPYAAINRAIDRLRYDGPHPSPDLETTTERAESRS